MPYCDYGATSNLMWDWSHSTLEVAQQCSRPKKPDILKILS